MRFVLASASPARLATLRAAGVEPEVIVSGVDESQVTAADTGSLVAALADLKARAVADRIDGPALVLGCDSMLDLDGVALGKPGTPEVAAQRWRILAIAQRDAIDDAATSAQTLTVSPATITVARGGHATFTLSASGSGGSTTEPSAVAGAFTLDGLGGWFVERVDGDPHNVVGVSLPCLRQMLAEIDRGLPDLGWPAPR